MTKITNRDTEVRLMGDIPHVTSPMTIPTKLKDMTVAITLLVGTAFSCVATWAYNTYSEETRPINNVALGSLICATSLGSITQFVKACKPSNTREQFVKACKPSNTGELENRQRVQTLSIIAEETQSECGSPV